MSRSFYEIPIRCQGIAVALLKKINGSYKVLLMKRAPSTLRDVWCYIGGGIEKGEKAWEVCLREIQEETSITKVSLYISNKFDKFYSVKDDYIYIAPVFVGYVDDDENVLLNEENKEYRWLTFDEAKELAILPGNDEVLEHIEKYFAKKSPLEWLRVK